MSGRLCQPGGMTRNTPLYGLPLQAAPLTF